MIRVGVVILRVLRAVILRVAILRVREEYLENTLRAGAYAHTRERRGSVALEKRREGREAHQEEHWECP